MNRLTKITLNLALVIGSFASVLIIAKLADDLAGAYLWSKVWPGRAGIIFSLPGTVDHYDMYDYKTTEVINSLGFRDDEIPFKSQHTYRIAAIGDSFTYGWGSNLEDTWHQVLERKLREQGMDVEIINFGKPAGGPQNYAQIAQTVVPLFEPDMVLVAVLAGDDMQQIDPDTSTPVRIGKYFPNAVRYYQYMEQHDWKLVEPHSPETDAIAAQKRYQEIAADIIANLGDEQRKNYEKLEPFVREVHKDGRLNPWLLAHSTGSPDYFMNTVGTSPELKVHVDALTEYFAQIRRAAKGGGARVIMLSIPEGFHVNEEAYANVQRIGFQMVPEMLTTDIPDQVMEKASKAANIPYFTATAFFRQRKKEKGLYLELDRHFTKRGNELFAEWALPVLMNEIGDRGKAE